MEMLMRPALLRMMMIQCRSERISQQLLRMLQHVPGQLQAAYVRVSLAQQLELGVRVGRATASFVTF